MIISDHIRTEILLKIVFKIINLRFFKKKKKKTIYYNKKINYVKFLMFYIHFYFLLKKPYKLFYHFNFYKLTFDSI